MRRSYLHLSTLLTLLSFGLTPTSEAGISLTEPLPSEGLLGESGAPSGWFAPLHTTIDVGLDSKRFFKGFTLADEPWLWTNVDLMTYPFHVYAMIGEADNGYDELNVGAGYFLDLHKNLKLRLGFEWDHYGQQDFFFENDYVNVNTLFYETPLGRASAEWAYDWKFHGDMFRVGFTTRAVPLTEQLSVMLDANLRYNVGWFGAPFEGWNNVDVTLNLPFKMNENVSLIGFLRYNEPLAAIDLIEDRSLSGGVTFRYEF